MSLRRLPLLCCLIGCGTGESPAPLDLAINGGRVIDPASDLDGIRHLGIRDGRIALVSEQPLAAADTIDATGLVVAPGFVDLHSHSIGAGGDVWQVRDGVTTSLELEEGASPVAEWYQDLEGKSLIHYGVAAGHIPTRIAVMQRVSTLAGYREWRTRGEDGVPPRWSHAPASPEELAALRAGLLAGIEAGGLGIGFEIAESPGSSREEVLMLFQLAKELNVPIYAHLRQMGIDPITGSLAGVQEVLANALATGASTHFVHLGSSSLNYVKPIVAMIEAAQARGLDVTGEVYPYTAASTGIQTALFDGDWRARLGISYGDLEWPSTGARLSEGNFAEFRRRGGAVIIHMMKDENVEYLIGRPGIMIASDAMPFVEGRGHPRGAGTFARVLGRYVREKGTVGLVEAIRKMTYLPAERVRGAAPMMARKGRLTAGADADVTIFDPAAVIDHATFDRPEQASTGIPWVVVGGTVVVRQGSIVPGAAPGRPVRRAAP
ncbi:MAG: amidohydrolase family protein [Gemmatimonadetes bacterium]|nr:amidohydrolase family protein [Gemmatimonadota bacterium]